MKTKEAKPAPLVRVGDKITLGVNPTIPLGDYAFLKPRVELTCVVEQGEEKIITVIMRKKIEKLLARAVLIELNALSEYSAAVEDGGMDALAAYCKKVMKDG